MPFAVLTFVIVGGLIFGLVILNIMAAEASFRLEELRQRTAQEEVVYRDTRYQVASRESPQQVTKAAETIGLVVPEKQEYILAPTPAGAADGDGGSFATAEQEKEGEELKALKRP